MRKSASCNPQFSIITDSANFKQDLNRNIQQYAEAFSFSCADMDKFPAFVGATPALFTTARSFAKSKYVGTTLADEPFRCEDYVALCAQGNASLLRLLCGTTCGCDDPFQSDVVYYGVSAGCSGQCSTRYRASLASADCADLDGEPSWSQYWDLFKLHVSFQFPTASDGVVAWHQFAERQKGLGCASMETEPVMGTHFCDDEARFFVLKGFRALTARCLHTCCVVYPNRTGVTPRICPASCVRPAVP